MSREGQPPASERQDCVALAGWLNAQRVLGQFALLLVFVTALVLLSGRAGGQEQVLALGVLLLCPLERYMALRLAFDRDLFTAWAGGSLDGAAIDRTLAVLRLMQRASPQRTFADRIAGTLRLQRLHSGIVLLQAALAGCALMLTTMNLLSA